MKKKSLALLLVVAVAALCFAGCSKSNDGNGDGGSTDGGATTNADNFQFAYNGTTVAINDEATAAVQGFGDPVQQTETESCAFQGMDKQYTYGGFEMDTYQTSNDSPDYILAIIFNDDTISTVEGAYIGQSIDDVKGIYGDGEETATAITYTKGTSTLTFFYNEEGKVDQIQYNAITQ